MTRKEFVKRIQAYYGGYPEGQRDVISAYLNSLPEYILDELLAEVIKNYDSKYKTVPDVAVFEKHKGAAFAIRSKRLRDQRTNQLLIESDNHRVVKPEETEEFFDGVWKKIDPARVEERPTKHKESVDE